MANISLPKNHFLFLSLFWFLLTVYGLFFYVPSSTGLPPFPHFDKFMHGALFFGQFWLLSKTYFKDNRQPPFRWLFILAMVWAGLSEILQGLLTATRMAEAPDAIADVVGATLALGLARYLWQLRVALKAIRDEAS